MKVLNPFHAHRTSRHGLAAELYALAMFLHGLAFGILAQAANGQGGIGAMPMNQAMGLVAVLTLGGFLLIVSHYLTRPRTGPVQTEGNHTE